MDPGLGVQLGLADDFVERPVVKKLDEFRICLLQFGFVIREKLLVILNGILGEAEFFHDLSGSWPGWAPTPGLLNITSCPACTKARPIVPPNDPAPITPIRIGFSGFLLTCASGCSADAASDPKVNSVETSASPAARNRRRVPPRTMAETSNFLFPSLRSCIVRPFKRWVGYSVRSEAMSMAKRYFTSDFSSRS
jgi:hypothetical protein